MAAPITAPNTINSLDQITGSAGVICVIINWIFWLLIILTIIFVLYAAYLYLTSAGEPDKVKESSHVLLYAAVAVIIALMAKGVPLIVSGFIGGGLSGNGCSGAAGVRVGNTVLTPPSGAAGGANR